MTPFAPDLYERLGLPSDATTVQVRRQFRLLARLYHPDRGAGDENTARYLAIQDAYRVLGDEALRAQYQQWRRTHGPSGVLELRLQSYPAALRPDVARQRLYLLLTIAPPVALSAPNKLPLNLILALDRSNSMRGQRLHYVREAARKLVATLSSRDSFGLVTFNDRAVVTLPAGPLHDLAVAYAAIDGIQALGGTEIAAGLRAAYKEAMAYHRDEGLSHILLLTDGRTYGDEVAARELVIRGREMGVGLSAFGLGADWNDELLDELVMLGGGSSHFIAVPQDVVTYFQARLGQLQQMLTSATTLHLSLAPGVTLLRAHEVAPGLRPLPHANDTITIGPLAAEPPLLLLLEFSVTLPGQSVVRLMDLSLEGEALKGQQSYRASNFLVLDQQAEAESALPDETILQAAHRVEMLTDQVRAWQAVRDGKVSGAVQALGQLAGRFREAGASDLLDAVEREVESLRETGELSPEGSKIIKYGTRRLALPAPEGGEA